MMWTYLSAVVMTLQPMPDDSGFSFKHAEQFAALAMDCVHREYPNKIAHVLSSDADVKPPRSLYPIFYGCFDWHSSVHGHWLLVRTLRQFPNISNALEIEAALERSFKPEQAMVELQYLQHDSRKSFERPYGLAWLLQLCAELREWDDARAKRWLDALLPIEKECARKFETWLPKLVYPIRTGEHSQTAFAFGLVLDWARVAGHKDLENLLIAKSKSFYLKDHNYPLWLEPSGQDFLSPVLAVADLMRRILDERTFSSWLGTLLPDIPKTSSDTWFPVARVTDRSDGKLAHLDGLNLSRAWMLEGIASHLPKDDARLPAIRASIQAHRAAGLQSVTGEHYEGGHWLGSFAMYLVTERGIKKVKKK